MSTGVDLDRAALDREYSPSSLVPDAAECLAEYGRRSLAARGRHPWQTVAYGESPAERFDFFPSGHGHAPLHVFVHGGHWQELGRADSAFAAPGFVQRGAAYAALGYGLAPEHSLDEIVAMVRRGLAWISANAARLGVDPQRIYASGSSAGAHLLAMCLTDGWLPPDRRVSDVLSGVFLLSGAYDLEPVRLSYVNDALGMDSGDARRNSPLHELADELPPVVIARAAVETHEYERQHEAMTAALRSRGARVTDLVVAGRHHFDLPFELAEPASPLGRVVLAEMGLPPGFPDLTVSSDDRRAARASGQPLTDFDGVTTPYIDYQSIDVLLSLQQPRSSEPAEMTFYVMGQVKELLLKLIYEEVRRVQAHLREDAVRPAIHGLSRLHRILEYLASAWEVLGTLSPVEFNGFRDHLGEASGFQSYMYRRVEFALGNKVEELARPHRGVPHVYPLVLADLREPSLYDEVLRFLGRSGFDVPAADRDFAEPYEPSSGVEAAWAIVYREPGTEVFELAEALIGLAERFTRWRLLHLLTVEKVIGSKAGSGGTTGVGWLRSIAGHHFFPELWTVRTAL